MDQMFIAFALMAGVFAEPEGSIPLQPYLAQQEALHATVNGVAGTFIFDTGEGGDGTPRLETERSSRSVWRRLIEISQYP